MQFEFAIFGYLVGTVVIVLGLLHSARILVRLTRFLLHEVHGEATALIDEVRGRELPQSSAGASRSTPTDTATPSAMTPAAARRSAS